MSEVRRILMNPGPVVLSERVRRALLSPDVCHREPEFAELQGEVRRGLESVYASAAGDFTAVLLTGSGTAAVEAMATSLVPREGKALVVANGTYGERIAAMLGSVGRAHTLIQAGWTEPPDLARIEQALDRDPDIGWILAVHHETTTGRLNDLAALGEIGVRRGVRLLVDAVSSFGAEEIDFAGWNLEACAATANKCLHGAPGVAFVVARRAALEARQSGAVGLYLDLFAHYRAQEQAHPLFTPAVHPTYALREALAELEEGGGWQGRRRHYRTLSGLLRTGLQARGARLLLGSEREYASSLTSFQLPEGIGYDLLHARLKQAGFVVYPGQRGLLGQIFRVAVMGAMDERDVGRFLAAFEASLGPHAPGQRLQAEGCHPTK